MIIGGAVSGAAHPLLIIESCMQPLVLIIVVAGLALSLVAVVDLDAQRGHKIIFRWCALDHRDDHGDREA